MPLINYKGFIIKDCEIIKQNINKFIKSIDINYNLFIVNDIYKFTLTENITILEYFIDRHKIKSNLKDIKIVFERILRIYLEECANSDEPFNKAYNNGKLCEFLIKYNFLFNHPLLKNKLNIIKKFFISRCYQLSIKQGCILSWITFATLCPEMINENCYLEINLQGFLYKYINWNYLSTNEILKDKIIIFSNYYQENITNITNENIMSDMKISYI
jgi:hypothetical protein